MIYYKSILICGGDRRQKYMYEYMKEKGINVNTFALFYDDLNDIQDIKKYDVIILPIPVTRDGIYLNSQRRVKLSDILSVLDRGQIVMGGLCEDLGITDYYNCECMQMQNAIPTAEGALHVAMENTVITINQSKCAILGYGRIGKILASMLKDLGAEVTVYARNPKDLELAKAFGHNSMNINMPEGLDSFDIIFNTVPKNVLDYDRLGETKREVVIIELASKPYGVDFEACEKLNRRLIVASGLPGKVAPKTAGKILCNVILDLLMGLEV